MTDYLSPVKRQILAALRDSHGEHYVAGDIAGLIGEPIFRVRAELNIMARRSWGPLVRHALIHRHRRGDTALEWIDWEWELTPAGEAISWGEIDSGL
jgi:hypothetical protein